MKKEEYRYPNGVLEIKEYNGQLIFNFDSYGRKTDFSRDATKDGGMQGIQKLVPDS